MEHAKARDARVLVRESRRTGSWQEVAVWLAASLNDLDASVRAGATARSDRPGLMWDRIEIAQGDHREVDLILLPDGTRVCWHMARTRRGPAQRAHRAQVSRGPFSGLPVPVGRTT